MVSIFSTDYVVYAARRARCRGPRVALPWVAHQVTNRLWALKTPPRELKNRRIKARMFRAFRMAFYRCTLDCTAAEEFRRDLFLRWFSRPDSENKSELRVALRCRRRDCTARRCKVSATRMRANCSPGNADHSGTGVARTCESGISRSAFTATRCPPATRMAKLWNDAMAGVMTIRAGVARLREGRLISLRVGDDPTRADGCFPEALLSPADCWREGCYCQPFC